MALMNCPECGQQVSGHAKACPKCAYPINPTVRPAAPPALPRVQPPPAQRAAPPVQYAAPPVQTIERTSKTLKGQVLASVLLLICGMFTTCVSTAIARETHGAGGVAQLGLLMFLGGLVWFIVTRIRIWWHHE